MHKSKSVFLNSVFTYVLKAGICFLKNWLHPDSRCPPPCLISNLCFTSCQDHMTPQNHQHYQQLRRDPPTTTELFRVPLGRLWTMVGRSWWSSGIYRNWVLCNSEPPGVKRVGHKLVQFITHVNELFGKTQGPVSKKINYVVSNRCKESCTHTLEKWCFTFSRSCSLKHNLTNQNIALHSLFKQLLG